MSEKEFPPIPEALLTALDKMFPERCPETTWTDREIWQAVGKRQVVRFLIGEFQRQNDNMRT